MRETSIERFVRKYGEKMISSCGRCGARPKIVAPDLIECSRCASPSRGYGYSGIRGWQSGQGLVRRNRRKTR